MTNKCQMKNYLDVLREQRNTNDMATNEDFKLFDEIDKRTIFKKGDMIKVVYPHSDFTGKIGIVTKVTEKYVYVEVNGKPSKWGHIGSLKKIWGVS